jgi:digeranylgeranylglycerophospholipid reductase
MDSEVDVLVVGAGPTGSTAARYAAAGGARTLLIEKRQEIGTPVRCGEAIGRNWLEAVDLAPSSAFVAREIEASRVFSPDGTSLTVSGYAGAKGGYVVERDLFDRTLAKEASRAGAEIGIKTSALGLLREGDRVVGAVCEHMGEARNVRASVVIGADGFESQMGRWAGMTPPLRTRDLVSCLQVTLAGVRGDAAYSDLHLGSEAPGGYAWVFWKGPDVANVGLGIPLSRLRDRAEVKRYLDAFIARRPGLAEGEVIEEVAGGVTTSLPVERSAMAGLLLAGDAARLIDPLTGAGIQNGLLSGRLAGETAAQAIREDDASLESLMAYDRAWRSRIEEDLARHFLVKEGLQRLDDATINRVFHAIAEADLRPPTVRSVLDVLRARTPEVLKDFEGLGL